MVEATFIASGETSTEALQMAASLSLKVLLGADSFVQSKKLDVLCCHSKAAKDLNAVVWYWLKYFLIAQGQPVQVVNNLSQIGCLGTKFSLQS